MDKVDLLFAIDNSTSMGDKQDLLASAVPVLVNRLLNPNCVSKATAPDPGSSCATAADCTSALGQNAQCDAAANAGAGQCFVAGDGQACITVQNTKPEFAAVHDLHVGIVSSSLGSGGVVGADETCQEAQPDVTHQNDKGHLLNRTLAGPTNGACPRFVTTRVQRDDDQRLAMATST